MPLRLLVIGLPAAHASAAAARPPSIGGSVVTAATGPAGVEVALATGPRGGVPLVVTVAGAATGHAVPGDVAPVMLPSRPGAPVVWRIERAA